VIYQFLHKHLGSGKTEAAITAPVVAKGAEVALPAADRRMPRNEIRQVMVSPALAGNEYIAEADIDRTLIAEVFSRCCMKVEFDGDGDVWVSEMDGPRVLVSVGSERPEILFLAWYRFKDGVSEVARQALAARCNRDVRMVRFRLTGDDVFMADYSLVCEGGLLLWQLVHSFRLFSRITMAALCKNDPEDILR
jgi:hypothetical protein